ncbi:LysR family transcriptional regulator [Acetobacter senegalensis]|uniref:LysR substrate-binding domain-containing protein n=1 Tax=Acetobacter senegalensis TaxID=446692 RepID=UPI00128D4291|nr:LysR family transcriptional regulator [Acetobacter senegalensis]MCG4255797.1 LysR family transcriptional regulator [Acetobacter senegalensis]MCG4265704.1 LysR family transcriptional regulator [Acetobacter senegalensis]MPQ73569.1 LysR family transcriptional regulator [Acetobacter senegalensis]
MILKQLYYLREIDRFKSFSKAAVACNVSQPALSRAVRILEEELGVVIIDRKKKVFGFTEEGIRILKWAHDILHSVTEMRNEVSLTRQDLAGALKIGVIPTAVHIVPVLIEAIQEKIGYFSCDVSVLVNADIIERLTKQQLDIGIMYYEECPQAQAFVVRSLYQEEQVLAGTAAYAFPEERDISWEDAAQFPLALLSKAMRCRQLVDTGFQAAGVKPIVRLETMSLELIHAEIMSGRLATILPISSFPLRVPPVGRLQMRRLVGFSAGSIGLVRLSERPPSDFFDEAWKVAQAIDYRQQFDNLCCPQSA